MKWKKKKIFFNRFFLWGHNNGLKSFKNSKRPQKLSVVIKIDETG